MLRHRYWRPMAITTTTGASNFFWMICGSILLVAVRSLGMSPELIVFVLTLGWRARRRVRRRAAVASVRRRADDRRGLGAVRATARSVPLAPASSPIPVLVLAFLVSTGRRHHLRQYRAQPHADPHARAPARPDERDPPVHRLRRDPARLADRRGARVLDRPALLDFLWVGAIGACFFSLALSPIRHIGAMPTEPEPDPLPLGAPLPTGVHLDA